MPTAVIFIPTQHAPVDLTACLSYCVARGYEIAAVVHGNWRAAADMITSGSAGIIVAASFEHLDPCREPRTEIVAPGNGDAAASSAHPRRRRPRRL